MQYCRIPCSTAEFCQLCSFPTISTEESDDRSTMIMSVAPSSRNNLTDNLAPSRVVTT